MRLSETNPLMLYYLKLIYINSNIRDDCRYRYRDRAPVAPRAQVLLLFVWFDPSRSSKIPKN
jgi:hypothetical protein